MANTDNLPVAKINIGGTYKSVWGGGHLEDGSLYCYNACVMGCRSNCTSYCWNSCTGYCGSACIGFCNSCTGSSMTPTEDLAWKYRTAYTNPNYDIRADTMIGIVKNGSILPFLYLYVYLDSVISSSHYYDIYVLSENAWNIFNSRSYSNLIGYAIGFYSSTDGYNFEPTSKSGPTMDYSTFTNKLQQTLSTVGYAAYSEICPFDYDGIGGNIWQAYLAFWAMYALKNAPSKIMNSTYDNTTSINQSIINGQVYKSYRFRDDSQAPETLNGYTNYNHILNKYTQTDPSLGSIVDPTTFYPYFSTEVITGNATNAKIRVGGTWKNFSGMSIRTGGTWKSV